MICRRERGRNRRLLKLLEWLRRLIGCLEPCLGSRSIGKRLGNIAVNAVLGIGAIPSSNRRIGILGLISRGYSSAAKAKLCGIRDFFSAVFTYHTTTFLRLKYEGPCNLCHALIFHTYHIYVFKKHKRKKNKHSYLLNMYSIYCIIQEEFKKRKSFQLNRQILLDRYRKLTEKKANPLTKYE